MQEGNLKGARHLQGNTPTVRSYLKEFKRGWRSSYVTISPSNYPSTYLQNGEFLDMSEGSGGRPSASKENYLLLGWGSALRGVRGAKPLSKIRPLPLDKGKGTQVEDSSRDRVTKVINEHSI